MTLRANSKSSAPKGAQYPDIELGNTARVYGDGARTPEMVAGLFGFGKCKGAPIMKPVYATALSVGILGAICTWSFLSMGTILVWAAFVAWACFFQSGGDESALKSTIISNIFGCFMGWLGAVMILGLPFGAALGPQVWSAIVVLITVVVYILASQVPVLASVPGTTFGYACTFAFLLQTPERLALPKLLFHSPPLSWLPRGGLDRA